MGRTILLIGDIDYPTALGFFQVFEELDRTPGDITIRICSPGGLTSAGFAIYDRIKMSQNKVIIEGYGEICSMAVAILQAGDVRKLAPNVRVMVHNTEAEVAGSFKHGDLKRTGKELREIGAMYNKILAERCGIPVKTIDHWCDGETYFNSREALANGLVDEVIEFPTMPAPKKSRKDK